MLDFEFKTRPYDHQRKALEESWAAEYYALFMEMGTGKSKVAIDNIAVLFEAGKINAAMIVAPKGVYDNWAKGEIETHFPDRIEKKVMSWRTGKSKRYDTNLVDFITEKFEGVKIFVINVEAFSSQRGLDAAKAFLFQNPQNMMIVDESTTIKNRKALRTKNLVALRERALYRRILTGSPITKSPMDLFSQCDFPKDCGLPTPRRVD